MNNFANKEFVLKNPRAIGNLKNSVAKEIYKHCSSYETMGGSIEIIEPATFEEIKEEYSNLKDEDILVELKLNKLYKVIVAMFSDCITRYIHLDLITKKGLNKMSNKTAGIPFREFLDKVTPDMFSTENFGNGKAVLYTGYWLHSDGCFYMYEENDEEYLRLED